MCVREKIFPYHSGLIAGAEKGGLRKEDGEREEGGKEGREGGEKEGRCWWYSGYGRRLEHG